MRAIIAAAGTGGHINPAITIANKIKEEEPDSEILFIGTFTGLENDLVPRAGYELKQIEAYGLLAELTISNLMNFIRTQLSVKDAKEIIEEFKPDVVIGTGGYICAPVFKAAIKLGLPTVLHESNAYPGKAIRLFNKKANKILLGFDKSKQFFRHKHNLVTVGNPIPMKKDQFTDNEKIDIFKNIGLNKDLPLVLVTGGSQGARTLNLTLTELVKAGGIKDFQIIWSTGREQYDKVKELLRESNIDINNIDNIKILPYIYNMDEILAITDLLVCRSGAMTVTEIIMLGKPAIFVPYPSSGANRQVDNAKVLEDIGAAKIILNKDLNKDLFLEEVNELIFDKERLIKMGQEGHKLATNNVIDRIYKEIKEVIN